MCVILHDTQVPTQTGKMGIFQSGKSKEFEQTGRLMEFHASIVCYFSLHICSGNIQWDKCVFKNPSLPYSLGENPPPPTKSCQI